MENYYLNLPENYVEDYKIDATNKKVGIMLNVIAFVIMILLEIPLIPLYIMPRIDQIELNIIALLVVGLGVFMYLILHELVHGLMYKIFTKQKLTFGLTLSVAFCGVPNIYTSKKTALIAVLAPLVVFSIVFLIVLILLFNIPEYFLAVYFIFTMHFSGCIGDMYCAHTLLFKYKKKDVLMNDTGPIQTFYVKKD